jgi:anaerobic magnesium-protoporphyrin IX monomethyl ester cyclase
MDILIVNPPHPAIGSRIPREQLPPLGLLCIGGPLLDAGHHVSLLDGELGPLSPDDIVCQVVAHQPQVLVIGHSGSTSAHPVVVALTRRLRMALPQLTIVYGGVFPTYHSQDTLKQEPQIDVIVRGEGEATVPALVDALATGNDLATIHGITLRREEQIVATPDAPPIQDLDAYRVGWELVDLNRYSYYGGKRAVVVQLSRGCPHRCSYCGQQGFWTRWRHRDPQKLAQEIAWLHRTHGVELFNLADENPTANRPIWREFCQAIIAENIDITLIGSTRADDIVRDADLLPLYRQAGVERFLLGVETTDSATLDTIRKGSTINRDRAAIRLLRKHGILSLVTWVTDFEAMTDRDFIRAWRQLCWYDPDQIMSLYVTPHRWTDYYQQAANRRVIQLDQTKWDYKHQVLATAHLPPWRIFLWIKLVEILIQLRPPVLWRTLFHADPAYRHGMGWFMRMGRRVWQQEWWTFFFRDHRVLHGPTLQQFWGTPEAEATRRPTRLPP